MTNALASASILDLCATLEEYDRIALTGRFSNGEPISADPELAASLASVADDIRDEIDRRASFACEAPQSHENAR